MLCYYIYEKIIYENMKRLKLKFRRTRQFPLKTSCTLIKSAFMTYFIVVGKLNWRIQLCKAKGSLINPLIMSIFHKTSHFIWTLETSLRARNPRELRSDNFSESQSFWIFNVNITVVICAPSFIWQKNSSVVHFVLSLFQMILTGIGHAYWGYGIDG
jgi:hypothetical protein